MDNVKNDLYYIQKIKQDIIFINTQMNGVDAEELYKNEVLLDSMLFRIIQISENAKKLSDDFRYIVLTNDSDITWEKVNKKYHSDGFGVELSGTIIIGMKVLE